MDFSSSALVFVLSAFWQSMDMSTLLVRVNLKLLPSPYSPTTSTENQTADRFLVTGQVCQIETSMEDK